MANLFNVVIFLTFLSSLGVCYSRELPQWSHVNVTYIYRSDEVIFLRLIRGANVNFDEGKRSKAGSVFPVVQEFVVEKNSIPDFQEMVERLGLDRTDYSRPMDEYVKLVLSTKDDRLQKKLKEAGLHIQQIKNGKNEWTTTYTVEVSLLPEVKAIASKLHVSNFHYDKTRLCRMVVTYSNVAAEVDVRERLKRFHVPVEIGKISDPDSAGKWDKEYFFEPSLIYDFAYAIGVTLI